MTHSMHIGLITRRHCEKHQKRSNTTNRSDNEWQKLHVFCVIGKSYDKCNKNKFIHPTTSVSRLQPVVNVRARQQECASEMARHKQEEKTECASKLCSSMKLNIAVGCSKMENVFCMGISWTCGSRPPKYHSGSLWLYQCMTNLFTVTLIAPRNLSFRLPILNNI